MALQQTTVSNNGHSGTLDSPLKILLERHSGAGAEVTGTQVAPFSSPVVGKIVGLSASGEAMVEFAQDPGRETIPARQACPITAADIGRDAVLLFEGNDPSKPIVLGLLQNAADAAAQDSAARQISVSLDGEQITFTARNEIVLRCGKASITLTRAGKVLIRGAYLLSRSSGVNRIKGGSVQIN